MQNLLKLILNSLYGLQICKDIFEFYKRKSEHWMQFEYDENVYIIEDYQTVIVL